MSSAAPLPAARPGLNAAAAQRAAGLLLAAIATLFGLVAIVFLLTRLLPNDPVLAIVGQDAPQQIYDRVHRELGLDRPMYEQFGRLVARLLRLDFGVSFLSGNPVAQDIGRTLPATIELGLLAVLLGGPVGVVLGMVAATRHGRWPDLVIRTLGLLFYSTPSFLLALIALLIFYYQLGWAEGPGQLSILHEGSVPDWSGILLVDAIRAGEWDAFRDGLAHLALPLGVLTVLNAAWFSRFCRTFALEEIGREYVLVARIKGVPERTVLWTHVFRNCLVQILTISAVALATSLEGSVLIETVFAWPGFGQYFVYGLSKGDLNTVTGCTFVVGVFFVVANMATEALFRLIDPRVR